MKLQQDPFEPLVSRLVTTRVVENGPLISRKQSFVSGNTIQQPSNCSGNLRVLAFPPRYHESLSHWSNPKLGIGSNAVAVVHSCLAKVLHPGAQRKKPCFPACKLPVAPVQKRCFTVRLNDQVLASNTFSRITYLCTSHNNLFLMATTLRVHAEFQTTHRLR